MEGEGRDGNLFNLKFRLSDGSDLGPRQYNPSITVAALKEDIVAQWSPERENGPSTVDQVKLIHAGRILQDRTTLAGSRLVAGEQSGGVITMHLIIRPPGLARSSETSENESSKQPRCSCSIL
ncbi:hypothetical protein MLD38_001467 [Melastoma candidum]|uniref:Uncharacterized protein n=1 Tax=Melastoma candidum TaxID=119954 RepID=A0ACB9SDF1_9MYRT|nr:hypothetical protein MLD38_001467 [Melastoma candidum]